MSTRLRDLIDEYIGGGWGSDVADSEHTARARVIRGTDIPSVKTGDYSQVPDRFHAQSNLRSRRLCADDIVFEVSGGSKDQPVGRTVLVSQEAIDSLGGVVIPASFCKRIRPNAAKVAPGFLNAHFELAWLNRTIGKWQVQSTGISNFKFEAFLDEFEIDLPALAVQRRILGLLSSYDELIQNAQRRIALFETIGRATFREWFVDFRFPGNDQHLVEELPKGWAVRSLAELMDIRGGSQPPKSEFVYNERPDYVRLIQIRDYESDAHLTFVRESSKLRVCARTDILIARYGASVARICSGLSGAYNVALAKVVPLLPHTQEFLRQFLASDEFQKLLIGMSGRAAQNGFNKADIAAIRLAVPGDAGLLERFERIGIPLRDGILNLKDQVRNLERCRQLLLPRLLSGQLTLFDSAA